MVHRYIVLILLALFIAACTSGDDDSLATNHALAGTQVADLRVTASVQAARAQTTVDFWGTRSSSAIRQSNAFQSTLAAAGTPTEFLATNQARYISVRPTETLTLTPSPTIEGGDNVAPPVQFTAPVAVSPTIPGVTPFSLLSTERPTQTPRPTVDANRPTVSNAQLATSPGEDDCGTGFSTTFTNNTPEIYITVFIQSALPNTLFESEWKRGDTTVGIFSYTPDFAISEACIWFFADQSDFAFEAGDYSVTLLANGQPITPVLPFTISN